MRVFVSTQLIHRFGLKYFEQFNIMDLLQMAETNGKATIESGGKQESIIVYKEENDIYLESYNLDDFNFLQV